MEMYYVECINLKLLFIFNKFNLQEQNLLSDYSLKKKSLIWLVLLFCYNQLCHNDAKGHKSMPNEHVTSASMAAYLVVWIYALFALPDDILCSRDLSKKILCSVSIGGYNRFNVLNLI